MRDNTDQPTKYHKEELLARLPMDSADRLKLQQKLEHCIDSLDPNGHPQELFNIVTRQIACTSASVDKAVHLGKASMEAYEDKLPEDFYSTISCPVTTMATKRKQVKLQEGGEATFDTEVLFNRTLGLIDTMDFNLKELFDYKLSQIPTALFTDDGSLRLATSKSNLKKSLKVEQSHRTIPDPQVSVLDGCAVLWTIHWPVPGTMNDLITTVERYLRQKLVSSDVYLIFDRYYPYSPKGGTRSHQSSATASGAFHLTANSPLPSQSASLSIVDNKVQIIDTLCDALIGRFKKEVTQRKLVITGSDPVPHDIKAGLYTRRADLTVTHEEADVIIANHVVHIARETRGTIHVVCDDTDVFVLLVHFYSSESLQGNIFMVPTRTSRSSVDIGATAKKHHDIARYILPLHALTGCDTVSTLYGIGRSKHGKYSNKGIFRLCWVTLTQVWRLWKPQLSDSLPDAMEVNLRVQCQRSGFAFGSIKLLGGNLTDSNLRLFHLPRMLSNCMSGEYIIKRVFGRLFYSPVLLMWILQILVGWQIMQIKSYCQSHYQQAH